MNANHLQQAFPDDVALDYVLDEVKTAIAAIARGEFVLVVDDEHRENEGNLIIAADALTPAHLAFMVRRPRGLIHAASGISTQLGYAAPSL